VVGPATAADPYSYMNEGGGAAAAAAAGGGLGSLVAGAGGSYYAESGTVYDGTDPSYYAGDDAALQQQQSWAQQHQPAGSYFEVPHLQPSLPYGGPIGAVAYDADVDAVYVATMAQSLSRNRRSAHRAALLVTHRASDGMLYSSVASHPEAPPSVLNAVYGAVYCSNGSSSNNSSASASASSPSFPWLSSTLPRNHHQPPPRHAYQPPYGKTDPALLLGESALPGAGGDHQLGVGTLVPVQAGTVASVSPSGVRVHRAGGMQIADQHLEGLLAGTAHPSSSSNQAISHLMVGGLGQQPAPPHQQSHKSNNTMMKEQQLHCLDLWQDLRIVSSHSLDRGRGGDVHRVAVTALATSYSRGCVAAGCSDGYLRLIDTRNRDLAKIQSHRGGVVHVAVSEDGQLIATTGYGSSVGVHQKRSSQLYGFPDPTVLVNDIRYLGRGGFPHSFSGAQGGPRFVSFVPETEGQPYSNRMLVASGQMGGGCQIMVPFQEDQVDANNFIIPQLDRYESVCSMCVAEEKLALGTSQGKVLQYKMTGYKPRLSKASGSGLTSGGIFVPPSAREGDQKPERSRVSQKQPLEVPPFQPVPPALSLEPTLLLKDEGNAVRIGVNSKMKSVFGTYILTADPTVSAIGDPRDGSLTSFGPLATNPLILQSRLKLSPALLCKSTRIELDSVQTIPMSEIESNILEDHRPERIKSRDKTNRGTLANPNKLIYTDKLFKDVYDESFNRLKLYGRRSRRYDDKNTACDLDDGDDDGDLINIPTRYRLMLRPANKSAGSFSHSDWNKTGILPGFDYPLTMPNAFVSPVLLLLYFIPELRDAALSSQAGPALVTSSQDQQGLLTEIGCLFYRIENLARFAMLFPTEEGMSAMTRVEAWSPASFLSRLVTMPEAERFQILDGSPAAIETPRRPEAFYRFLMYHLDDEISRGRSAGLLDSLGGTSFVSVNEYISGSSPPSKSTTRHFTVDLSYDYFLGPDYKSDSKPCFGELLQYNLCKATRLRAWSSGSKSYETIVQRKIVTSLPSILTLSAACAGRKEEEGLVFWKDSLGINNHWLPEMVEVEIAKDGSVIVRELVHDEKTGRDSWKECKGAGPISPSVSKVVIESTTSSGARLRRYRLDAVVSLVRDDLDRACPEEVQAQEGAAGHHVLHVRVPKSLKKCIIQQQIEEVKTYLASEHIENITDMTLIGRVANHETFQKRCDYAQSRLDALEEKKTAESSWIIVNGFVVSDTVVEDARAFHVKFKEPSLVIFRAVDDVAGVLETTSIAKTRSRGKSKAQRAKQDGGGDLKIPPEVLRTTSLTNGSMSPHSINQKPSALPGKGDLVAFDAEFVAVAEEESVLTLTGSKVVVRETRHALARISVIDGRSGLQGADGVVFDDYVQPNEKVLDYLTRFSGIVEDDLNPKRSRHHLISSRAAYLKLRCLVERGCIFVGHGLQQDFWTANLAVPASQIIDTVDIYHKPAQRYISLRFLANFVLKREYRYCAAAAVAAAVGFFYCVLVRVGIIVQSNCRVHY